MDNEVSLIGPGLSFSYQPGKLTNLKVTPNPQSLVGESNVNYQFTLTSPFSTPKQGFLGVVFPS